MLGGFAGGEEHRDVFVYDTRADRWSRRTPLPRPNHLRRGRARRDAAPGRSTRGADPARVEILDTAGRGLAARARDAEGDGLLGAAASGTASTRSGRAWTYVSRRRWRPGPAAARDAPCAERHSSPAAPSAPSAAARRRSATARSSSGSSSSQAPVATRAGRKSRVCPCVSQLRADSSTGSAAAAGEAASRKPATRATLRRRVPGAPTRRVPRPWPRGPWPKSQGLSLGVESSCRFVHKPSGRGPRATASRSRRRTDDPAGEPEAEQPRDHHPLHLVRPLADLEDLLVAVEARDRELVHVAVASVQLQRPVDDPVRHLARVELRHRRVAREVAA